MINTTPKGSLRTLTVSIACIPRRGLVFSSLARSSKFYNGNEWVSPPGIRYWSLPLKSRDTLQGQGQCHHWELHYEVCSYPWPMLHKGVLHCSWLDRTIVESGTCGRREVVFCLKVTMFVRWSFKWSGLVVYRYQSSHAGRTQHLEYHPRRYK